MKWDRAPLAPIAGRHSPDDVAPPAWGRVREFAWHLPRLDRVMMQNRVEVRSPFLARRVAAAALALPWSERKNKQVLRDLFRGDLPPTISSGAKIPLRTREVERDREDHSLKMVQAFMERTWPKQSASPAA